MRNVALLEMGARLSQASSHHSSYPASGIIDKYVKNSFSIENVSFFDIIMIDFITF